MDVKPFRIERYYARHEFTTRYMLSSSDCESRTIEELLGLSPTRTSVCSRPGAATPSRRGTGAPRGDRRAV